MRRKLTGYVLRPSAFWQWALYKRRFQDIVLLTTKIERKGALLSSFNILMKCMLLIYGQIPNTCNWDPRALRVSFVWLGAMRRQPSSDRDLAGYKIHDGKEDITR